MYLPGCIVSDSMFAPGGLPSGQLSQSVSTTPGASYTINFFLAAALGAPNSFSVSWGGVNPSQPDESVVLRLHRVYVYRDRLDRLYRAGFPIRGRVHATLVPRRRQRYPGGRFPMQARHFPCLVSLRSAWLPCGGNCAAKVLVAQKTTAVPKSFTVQEWSSFLGGHFCLYVRHGRVGVYRSFLATLCVRRTHNETLSASQDRARIVFDCRIADDPATINRESTNENNTDVDRWTDARRLRINGKQCS